MAQPFRLSLISKFSFGRPSMDIIRKFFISLGLKGNSQISLLDNRHILIKLSTEEDYSRIWLRQSWYVNGRCMRIFKWSKDFRCSSESPIVPVWVSLPYLPVHFIHCKSALYSIAAAIGYPLRVDHATASVNRPSVARVLIEYDISKPLVPRIWIGEGDSGFWQSVVFEKIPAYCTSCMHLGHSTEACLVTSAGLRKAHPHKDSDQRPVPDKGNHTMPPVDGQPSSAPTVQHTVVSDSRPLGPTGEAPHPPVEEEVQVREPDRGVGSDIHSPDSVVQVDTDDGSDRGVRYSASLRSTAEDTEGPQAASAGSRLLQAVASDLRTLHVGFNSHSRDIPSQSDDDSCFEGDNPRGDDSHFLTDTDSARHRLPTDAVIDNLGSDRVSTSPHGFTVVTRRKRRQNKRRDASRPLHT